MWGGGRSFPNNAQDQVLTASTVTGEEVFTSSGTWTCPVGVTSVSVVAVGAGGGPGGGSSYGYGSGGGGGALAYRNHIPVVAGRQYTVNVGSAGASGGIQNNYGQIGGMGGETTFGYSGTGAEYVVAGGGHGGYGSQYGVALGRGGRPRIGIGGTGGSCQGRASGSSQTAGGGLSLIHISEPTRPY